MGTKRTNVLDHGFVELIDFMGSDQRVVDAARVSVAGDKVKPTSDNRGLIRYLMRNKHMTPFEMPQLTFAIKMPILVMRQLVRHRTASINEMSGRYGVLPDEFYIPEASRLNVQAKNNHQGSDPQRVDSPESMRVLLQDQVDSSYEFYEDLLEQDLARELARNVLPVSVYTKIYWTVDLRNLFHFLALRRDGHAQYEIRVYADAMWEMIQPLFPLSCEAWEDYVYNARTFSAEELHIIQSALLASEYSLEELGNSSLSKREKEEFIKKLKLGEYYGSRR